jgi:hypothetical protein
MQMEQANERPDPEEGVDGNHGMSLKKCGRDSHAAVTSIDPSDPAVSTS